MKVGKKIRIIRELLGYSQDFMSIELEISQATYSRIENECTRIDISMIMRIVDILNISIINLLQFDESYARSVVTISKMQSESDLLAKQNIYENRIKYLEEKVDMIQQLLSSKS